MVTIYCASLVCVSIAVSREHSVLPYTNTMKKLLCRARALKCCLWNRAHVCACQCVCVCTMFLQPLLNTLQLPCDSLHHSLASSVLRKHESLTTERKKHTHQ